MESEAVAYVRNRLFRKHNTQVKHFCRKQLNCLIFNEKAEITGRFKENLVSEDKSDFLRRLYKQSELKDRLTRIFDFYETYSKIFPNYTSLPHSAYFYKNIQRKQRMIDNLEEQEECHAWEGTQVLTEEDKHSIEEQSLLGELSLQKIIDAVEKAEKEFSAKSLVKRLRQSSVERSSEKIKSNFKNFTSQLKKGNKLRKFNKKTLTLMNSGSREMSSRNYTVRKEGDWNGVNINIINNYVGRTLRTEENKPNPFLQSSRITVTVLDKQTVRKNTSEAKLRKVLRTKNPGHKKTRSDQVRRIRKL